LLNEISIENNNKEIWTTRDVLVNEIKWDKIIWYADNMKQIIIDDDKSQKINLGDFVSCKIVKSIAFKLLGVFS
jgi:tRNA A37 methylthiotransferase MiaB